MIEIKDNTGSVLLSTEIRNGSKRKFELMKEDYIILKFNLEEPVTFGLGTNIECDFGLFEVTEKQFPKWNTSNGGYDYELKLDAHYWKWKNKIFKYTPETTGGNEASWSLTASLSMHLEIFMRNLKAWGYTYKGTDYHYELDDTVTSDALFITYSNTNLLDALSAMAEAAGCEWWVDGPAIRFGRLENGEAVTLKVGESAESMSLSKSSGDYFTRIFAFGSTQNISTRYRKKLEFIPRQVGTDSSEFWFSDTNKPLSVAYFRDDLVEYPSMNIPVDGMESMDLTAHAIPDATGGASYLSSDTASFMLYEEGQKEDKLMFFKKGGKYSIRLSDVKLEISSVLGLHLQASPINVKAEIVADGNDVIYSSSHTVSTDPSTITLSGVDNVNSPYGFQSLELRVECSLGSPAYLSAGCLLRAYGNAGFASAQGVVTTRAKIYKDSGVYDKEVKVNKYAYPDGSGFEHFVYVDNPEGMGVHFLEKFTIDGLILTRVPLGYFAPDMDGLTVNGVVQSRLMLPEGIPYIDIYEDMHPDEIIEGIVVFDYVFPGKTLSVSSVDEKWIDQTETDSEGNEKPTGIRLPVYTIHTKDLTGFKSEYIIGDNLTATFQTGSLAGLSFVLSFVAGESNDEETVFEVVANEDYGGRLPDTLMKPSAGSDGTEDDTFVIAGYDTEYLFSGLTEEAEQRLLTETEKYKEKLKGNVGTVSATMFSGWSMDRSESLGALHPLQAGQRVIVDNASLFPTPTELRVIGYELALDIPCASPVYTIGESASYSRLGELEDKIDSVSLNGSRYMASAASSAPGRSVYLIGMGDPTSPSDSNAFSALRTKAEISQKVAEEIEKNNAELEDRYIHKDRPDLTEYLIRFLGGLEVGDAVDSMQAGKGIVADTGGRMQLNRIEVRDSMTVMDLIINEIHSLAGDYSFSDSGKIESVEGLGEATYKLRLRKETETDVTGLDVNDIVYSIVNNLRTGGTDYYTSWMRVIAKNTTENTITVVLYPDSEVPGGKNYPPMARYNLTRRGNTDIPSDGGGNERAQSWLLSSREGRIMFLQNVYKPILEDYNYALTLGRMPDIKALEQLAIPKGAIGVTAQYMVAERFFEFDYNGDVRPKQVDRGNWSLDTAQSTVRPYRFIETSVEQATGTTYTLLEQHTVYHKGCKWACLIDKTVLEPKWNSPGWQLVEGDRNYSLVFDSTAGWSFFSGRVDTEVSVLVKYGSIDITEDVMALAATEVEWTRDSGNAPLDSTWTPQPVEGKKNAIRLTNYDMPPGFGGSIRQLRFTCRVYIPDGENGVEVENYIGITV